MSYPPPMGATDHYAPATSLMEAWLQGSPTSLKAQEVALQAIAAQLRSIQADYQKTNEHIKQAYPAGAGALALVETGLQITEGMDHATGTLSGKDKSLSQIIGEAATNLASTQNSTSTIKTVFDALVQALESSVWTEWAAPGVAYVGTFAEIIPAAVQLMEMYNTVSTFVDNMNPDDKSSQLVSSDAGGVGQGYQANNGMMPVDYQTTSPYGQAGSTAPWQDATGQWHYPSATTPWQDATGQWHAPTGATAGTANGYGSSATYPSSLTSGAGSSGTGSSGFGSSGTGSSGFGSSGTGSSGFGSSGAGSPSTASAPVSVPDLSSGWQPVDSAAAHQGVGTDAGTSGGSGSTGGGSGGDHGAGTGSTGDHGTGSGTGSSGDHGTGTSGSGSGSGSGDHGAAGSGSADHSPGSTSGHPASGDHTGGGVTVTITEGDSSMTVSTDQDGHFAGTLHGHEVDIDVDIVEARTAASAQGA